MPTFDDEKEAVVSLRRCIDKLSTYPFADARKRARLEHPGADDGGAKNSARANASTTANGITNASNELCPGCKRYISERNYSQHLAKCLNSNIGRSAALKAEAKLGSRATSPLRSDPVEGPNDSKKANLGSGKKRGRPPKTKDGKESMKPTPNPSAQSELLSNAITAATQRLHKATGKVTKSPDPSSSSSPSGPTLPFSTKSDISPSKPPKHTNGNTTKPIAAGTLPVTSTLGANNNTTRPVAQPNLKPKLVRKRALSRNSSQASSSSESDEEPVSIAALLPPKARVIQPPLVRQQQRHESDDEIGGVISQAESSSGSDG